MNRKLGLMSLMGALLLSVHLAWADGDFYVIVGGGGVGTPITSVPYTIKQPGFYYLKGDLTASTTAIAIDADDVTLDLMGYCLSGNGIGVGINVVSSHNNVEVRNGTVRNFDYGFYTSGIGNRIIKLSANNNVRTGIIVYGNNCAITGCNANNNGTYGYDITSGGVIIGNVAFNNSTGFYFNDSSVQLVDRNSSYGNTSANWAGITKCTVGINAP